eukprot:1184349-Rhodomonas_salina.2
MRPPLSLSLSLPLLSSRPPPLLSPSPSLPPPPPTFMLRPLLADSEPESRACKAVGHVLRSSGSRARKQWVTCSEAVGHVGGRVSRAPGSVTSHGASPSAPPAPLSSLLSPLFSLLAPRSSLRCVRASAREGGGRQGSCSPPLCAPRLPFPQTLCARLFSAGSQRARKKGREEGERESEGERERGERGVGARVAVRAPARRGGEE